MLNDVGCKTEYSHWDAISRRAIKNRLPSSLNVGVWNTKRLLKKYVRSDSRYLEIGCAPGKILAWVAGVLKADVAGLDYSESGIAKCRSLFEALKLKVDLYQEDLFNHHLLPASFDVVASFGVIEHFDDAQAAVQRHIELVKDGGMVLIVVPNYGGIYGWLQRWSDASNLALHNLEIMSPNALMALADLPNVESVRAYFFGAMSPWLVNFDKRLPSFLSKLVFFGVNAIGLLQPIFIKSLAPMLVLEIKKD
jgi:2-polyprenyl-3-methyl-5-hydroxy-6-metoxy-1,4-benzoquinol methylase